MRSLTILGSTGSVGTQALDVVRRNPDRFKVVGLAALTNHELLVGQIREFLPPYVAIADPEAAGELREMLGKNIRGVDIIDGPDAAERLSRDVEADMVLNALVGSAGLPSTLAALQSGKTLALANKESLVIGGELVMDLIKAEPDRLGWPVPGLDPQRPGPGVGEGGPGPSGVADGSEDHRRLRDPDEQGHGGHRGPLPVRHRLLADPRDPPPRGGRPRADRVPRRHDAFPSGFAGHAAAHPARAGLAGAPADRHRSSASRRQAAHVRAGRPRGFPRGRPGLPGWSARPDVPRGHERGQRGRGHRLPGGQDPPHADRRDRPGCRGRARGARVGGLGGQPRAGRLLGPTACRGDHRGPLTEGWIKAIPAGGYVKIAGMNPYQETPEEELPRTFGAKPIWQRALVIAAGPATHFVLAFVCFALWLGIVGEVTPIDPVVDQISTTLDGTPSPAAQARLQAGDRIVGVDGIDHPTSLQLIRYTRSHVGMPITLTILRDGREFTATLTPVLSTVMGERVGRIGVGLVYGRDRKDVVGSMAGGAGLVGSTLVGAVDSIGRVFGPEGISRIGRLLFTD